MRLYVNAAVKATFYADKLEEEEDALKAGKMGMCCNSRKRVGLINMKRAAGLVTPAKINYSD